MSTRARIGIVNADKTITSIYTHNNGYISHHGPILLNHYDTTAKLQKLLSLGSLSVLGEDLGKKHDFDTPWNTYPTWCKAYRRDRADKNCGKRKHETCTAYLRCADASNAMHTYLFNDDGKWYVSDTDVLNWKELALEVIKERMTT